MGIRFFCPNGHKLHVKSQLAGLRGFCPECGIDLVVPMESTRRSSKEGGGLIINSDSKTKNNSNQNLQPNIFAMFNDSANNPNNTGIAQNPLLQDQSVEWYICNPEDGQQQGPLKSQAIQKLIQQRQIQSNFFIWYEGLTDWVLANSIFPELDYQ
ncbi:MAG: DUF4339 domain-containing protein [Planctomycetaceae bacterium]|jgi:hypothetical protein|nr:DUF4339 domain-containing protein [Planctomycetaceae bacterium]